MIITHKIEMDLAGRDWMPRIDVVQGDTNTRLLELTLLEAGSSWEIPEDVQVWVRYCKSDGTRGVYDTMPDGRCAWSAEKNVLSCELAPQMLTTDGIVLAQVELVQGDASVATFAVQIGVERNPAAGAVTSEDYVNMLQWMQEELNRMLAQARDSGEFNGPQGVQGPRGETGPDVFDYAVAAGFTGSETEFKWRLTRPCLEIAGGLMTGPVHMGGNNIYGLSEPANAACAANKAYVDGKRSVATVLLPANGWSSTLPYVQTVAVAGVKAGDWLRLRPGYTGTLETDLAMKTAFDRISYADALDGQVRVVCLQNKPIMDLAMSVEAVR